MKIENIRWIELADQSTLDHVVSAELLDNGAVEVMTWTEPEPGVIAHHKSYLADGYWTRLHVDDYTLDIVQHDKHLNGAKGVTREQIRHIVKEILTDYSMPENEAEKLAHHVAAGGSRGEPLTRGEFRFYIY